MESRSLMLLALIFVVGGIFGFVYEELFYRVDLGYWVKRGSTFGPWIPIYGVGAVLIKLTTSCLRDRPFLLFMAAVVISGMLEYVTGWILLHVFHIRLWDYNVEIWNWGNVSGLICLRSVLFFGVSAMILQYIAVPILDMLAEQCDNGVRCLLALAPCILFVLDILGYKVYQITAHIYKTD